MSEEAKACTKCGVIKPLVGFCRDSGRKDGRNPECRACVAVRTSAYRAANAERIRDRKRAYYQANQEKIRQKHRAYYLFHVEEISVSTDAWRAANRQKVAQDKRNYYLSHREQAAESLRKYRSVNGSKLRDQGAVRRARQLSAFVEHVSRSKVYKRDNGRCHVCGNKVRAKDWHLDHLVPLALGGEHSYRNVAVSCPQCNRKRGTRGPAQLRLIG